MKMTFREYLAEARVLTQMRLTNHQKKILAIILMTDDRRVHDEQISSDRNMVAARDFLIKLKLIEPLDGDWIGITDIGIQTAEQENVTDNGQVTSDSAQLATSTNSVPSGKPSTSPSAEPSTQPFAPTSTDTGL